MAYGDDTGFEAWLDARGLSVSGDSTVLRQLGSDYVDSYENRLTGTRADPDQDDAWPRVGASVNCVVAIASDVIPKGIVNAAYRAGYLADTSPGILTPVISGQRAKRKKVDVVEVEYFDDGNTTGFVDPTIDAILQTYICDETDTGGFFFGSIGS